MSSWYGRDGLPGGTSPQDRSSIFRRVCKRHNRPVFFIPAFALGASPAPNASMPASSRAAAGARHPSSFATCPSSAPCSPGLLRPGKAGVGSPPVADILRSLHLFQMPTAAVEEPRRLTMWLLIVVLIVVLTLPLFFSWFTLRRGYSKDVRLGAFPHLALAVLIGIAPAAAD